MVNQICIAGLLQSLSEGLRFAEAAGLDPLLVVEVISKGAAQSRRMENRHKTMLSGTFAFGFAVDWMRKDLAIYLDEARRNGASLPVAALVDQFYAQIQSKGGGRWDTSSLINLFPPRKWEMLICLLDLNVEFCARFGPSKIDPTLAVGPMSGKD